MHALAATGSPPSARCLTRARARQVCPAANVSGRSRGPLQQHLDASITCWVGPAGPRTAPSHHKAWPTRQAVRPVGAVSSSTNTELLTSEVRALEAERDTAISTAESCAKTATKLAEMARLLEQLALDKVRNGDELGAKQALHEKQSVREAMDKNSSKADANYQLAAVLASKIAEKQAAVLAAWRAGASGSPPPAGSSSSSNSPQPLAGAAGETPKWKWQQSLEEAKERLKAQEAEGLREGRMARMSAESSILQAKERIARQAQASVLEGLERLRAVQGQSAGSLEAAQARLRARDEETLMYVRRVMSRYRRGDYVSEDELEFAFQQLERRFML